MGHRGRVGAIALTVLLVAQRPSVSLASSIAIVDSPTAFPFMRNVEHPADAMKWDSGTLVQLLSSCKLIRITRRGVRCIAASDTLISGWQRAFLGTTATAATTPPQQQQQQQQHKVMYGKCVPTNKGLCATSEGNFLFPTEEVFVAEASVGKCRNGQGRSLLADNSTSTSTTTASIRDDVSLCDVIDNNMDIVYDPVHNYIYMRHLGDSTWLYTTISILVLIVVVLTAEAVSQRSRSQLVHNIFAWILLTTATILMLLNADGRMHVFITVQDRAFVTVSLLYIIVTTGYWVSCAAATAAVSGVSLVHTTQTLPQPQRDGINAMIASVHFATCVLYGTPDNTYVSVFFFVFLFRTLQKMHDAHYRPIDWSMGDNTMLLLDLTYTVTIFSFGILPHFTNDAEIVLYAAAQYMVCDTIAANCILDASALENVTPVAPEPTAAAAAAAAAAPAPAKAIPAPVTFTPAPSMPQGVGPGWTDPQ
jgi:hypothetical protein